MRTGRILGLLTIACAMLPAVSSAALQCKGGSASFDAAGPAGLKIQGKTSDVSVSETGGSVQVTVSLATLDTGIPLRNRHMTEKYLEVQKYPNAVLVVERSALKFPDDGKDIDGQAKGTMSLHGQTRPVVFNYKAHRNHDMFDVNGNVHLNINEYGITVPSYLGITVKPDIDVAAHFAAHDV